MAHIDIDKLSKMVRERRGAMNLKEATKEIGDISISTLSRVEQGKIPDLNTFILLCDWLNINQEEFTVGYTNISTDHKEDILYHLRADSTLSKDVAEALKKMIEIAYANSEKILNEEGVQ
jgi:transcriptional regulator with XRE-family HTH domain